MAQYASRASVNLHTHIFFRNQKRDETGYVLFVRQNAVQVSVILNSTQLYQGAQEFARCRRSICLLHPLIFADPF